MSRKFYSEAEHAKIVEMIAKGSPTIEIANFIGRPVQSLYAYIQRHELKEPDLKKALSVSPEHIEKPNEAINDVRKNGLSYAESAKKHGINRKTLHAAVHRRKRQAEAAQETRQAPLSIQDSRVLQAFNRLFIAQAITTNHYKLAGV